MYYCNFLLQILLNLFVAIILDNLDKDEENKRKELEERVQLTENDKIPHHLRLLDKLKIPVVRNKVKVAGVFDVPNIDESAVREYVQQGEQKLQEAVKEQHNNKKRMSYVEGIDDDDEESAVDIADDDKVSDGIVTQLEYKLTVRHFPTNFTINFRPLKIVLVGQIYCIFAME